MSQTSTVIGRHSRSFSLASRFLPRRIRRDVIALYAWCRTADEAVDSATDKSQAARRLEVLKQDLVNVTQGRPVEDQASQWIAPLLRSGRIEAKHALDLLEGMHMDLNDFHVHSQGDLRRYCYHAAGTVGLMMCQLMGASNRIAHGHALALGRAMQMSNIARDVLEDAQRGRSYLPGIQDPLQAEESRIRKAVQCLIATSESEYAFAAKGIQYLPRDCRPAIRIALCVYREIGREIARQSYSVMKGRVVVSRPRILAIALAATLFPNMVHQQYFGSSSMTSNKQKTDTSREYKTAQAKSAVCFGLSMTAIMAAVLFILVFVNPKSESYGFMPLAYAGISAVVAIATYHWSIRLEPSQSQQ